MLAVLHSYSYSVIPPLTPCIRRMVNRSQNMTRGEIISVCVSLAGPGTVFLMWLTGALATGAATVHDISVFRNQLDSMQVQIAKLGDKIDLGPRSDQLRDVDRRLSGHDGRMDSLQATTNELLSRLARVEAMQAPPVMPTQGSRR